MNGKISPMFISTKLNKLERCKESEELSGYERSKDIYMEKNRKYISEL
jgi:hypothetical protein